MQKVLGARPENGKLHFCQTSLARMQSHDGEIIVFLDAKEKKERALAYLHIFAIFLPCEG